MELSLSEEEREILSEALNGILPSLRQEVYKTENYDYRKQLQQKEAVLKGLLLRLDPAGIVRSS
jgi:hypothetical protein